MSAFLTATRSGDLQALTQLLASDVRFVTDGGGKVPAAQKVLEGADRVAQFLIETARRGWRDDFTVRFATINGLPGPSWTAPRDRADGGVRD
jgi:RNA polymerase sigma-70 factor, ECF subfamily